MSGMRGLLDATRLRVIAGALATAAITATVLSGAGATAAAQTGSEDGTQGARLLFSEDFDGDRLDKARWHTCHWWAAETCSIEPNNELELYRPGNVSVAGGHLQLEARREQAKAWNGETYDYTSGMVSSGGLEGTTEPGFTFTYGYMEARIDIPVGQGLWPAFWALPDDHTWPPEIDAMEILGHETDRVHMNYHWKNSDGSKGGFGEGWTGPDFGEGFHTFGVDWQPNAITWYVDGVERLRFSDQSRITAKQHYVLLNLAVGGDWPGAPDASTVFPARMLVDWVRVWDRFPGGAEGSDPPQTGRLSGRDRIDTSVAISQAAWQDGEARAAVLSRSDNFPDALAGGPLAAFKKGPLLLTHRDRLSSRVGGELSRALSPGSTVYLLGGEAALASRVADEVRALGFEVRRFGGANRFATAITVATEGLGDPSAAIVVTGTDFPDALSAGAASKAAAGSSGSTVPAAVVLTDGARLPAETRAWLESRAPKARYAVGGAAAQADPAAEAIVGADRYETSQRVAERFFGQIPQVSLASGRTFADALSGGAHALDADIPLLLSDPDDLPRSTESYLKARRGQIQRAVVYGGPSAVSHRVTQKAAAAFSG